MTASFQIDTVAQPLDPFDVKWDEKEVIGRNRAGAPIFNIKRTAHLKFDPMSTSDLTTFIASDNGSTHSAKIPAPSSGTYTTYSGVYVRLTGWHFEDVHVEDVELEISWIEL